MCYNCKNRALKKELKVKRLYHIYFYVPSDFIEVVKEAMFEAGAGKVGEYDKCSWQTLGKGQFRALDKANPFLGEKGVLEEVVEYKVEMVCAKEYLEDVIKSLKKSHPYEEVAYGVVELFSI
jgi:hypothetical protein